MKHRTTLDKLIDAAAADEIDPSARNMIILDHAQIRRLEQALHDALDLALHAETLHSRGMTENSLEIKEVIASIERSVGWTTESVK